LRKASIKARPRTQSSIAVGADGESWILFNASPDIRQQLEAFAGMQPGRTVRDTAIAGVVLVDGHIDHTTGLLMLREGGPLRIYCTDAVFEDLSTNHPILNVLDHFCGVRRSRIPVDRGSDFRVEDAPALRMSAIPLASKPPPFSPHRSDPRPGDNIGIRIEDENTGGVLFYAPALGSVGEHVSQWMSEADCILVDGTFWVEDELANLGITDRRASEMGHLPLSGDQGILSVLRPLAHTRRILIHINNTNPILDEKSEERSIVEAAGIEVAYDGMEITL
jgi:pyrroloquinoline quinone biosynthesis protein B